MLGHRRCDLLDATVDGTFDPADERTASDSGLRSGLCSAEPHGESGASADKQSDRGKRSRNPNRLSGTARSS